MRGFAKFFILSVGLSLWTGLSKADDYKAIKAKLAAEPDRKTVISFDNKQPQFKIGEKYHDILFYLCDYPWPLAGSDAPKKERSVFYRGVERTKHSESPVKIGKVPLPNVQICFG